MTGTGQARPLDLPCSPTRRVAAPSDGCHLRVWLCQLALDPSVAVLIAGIAGQSNHPATSSLMSDARLRNALSRRTIAST